jgi:hypothetical protein
MHQAAAASDRYRWVEALKSEINDRLRSADQNLGGLTQTGASPMPVFQQLSLTML